ncbi:MAG: chemotaxis protein CheA [Gammaproteobacteria bacterium]|nr:chemotaxis protein CheA [Gammaproteobacteria bacterium]
MAVDLTQFHEVFFEESFEGLEIMESGLLNLSAGSDDIESINDIFRAAHSIKGGAGTFGFNQVSEFTHDLETLLDQMRDGRSPVTDESVELLLLSVDCLKDMLKSLVDKSEIDCSAALELTEKFKSLLERNSQLSAAPAVNDTPKITSPNPSLSSKWIIEFKPHGHVLQTGNEPYRIIRELSALGEIDVEVDISDLQPYAEMEPTDCHLSWMLKLSGLDLNREKIDEVFEWVADESDINICEETSAPAEQAKNAPVAFENGSYKQALEPENESLPTSTNSQVKVAPESKVAELKKESPKKSVSQPAESKSIRVNIDKVDSLINMVGEMVITQSMLCALSKDFSTDKLDTLVSGLAELEASTRELQENVMSLRMIPISFAFNRFPRLVRDLNSQLGKKVVLELKGTQTELDKTVMEKLSDPLTHLVRNSMDHGMETPEQRVALGKPEQGNVELNAYYESGSVVIQVRDDGAGLDVEKIRAKAIKSNLIDENDVYSDDEMQNFIFRAGFSTAEKLSDVSGRGVGLDVVTQNIKSLKGTLDVKSVAGEGSVFTIRLPLTLAILDGQLLQIGNGVYIVPLVSIIESLQIDENNINRVAGGGSVYRLRDENIIVAQLDGLFGYKDCSVSLHNKMMIVVESSGKKVGLVVDALLNQQQVVIKSLETNYGHVEGISGATILGDGMVALICDIHVLVDLALTNCQQNQGGVYECNNERVA